MKTLARFLPGITLAAIAAAVATPAAAIPVTSIQIQVDTSKVVAGDQYLQFGELVASSFTSAQRLETQGTATATGSYFGTAAPARGADGDTSQTYPNIYHGTSSTGSDVWTLTFTAPINIDQLTIYGRDQNVNRDYYVYRIYNGTTTPVRTGTLDASDSTSGNVASVNLTVVPEPAAWGMMILGMGAVGVALRRRVRVSERKFDDRIARMTAGEIA